MTAERHIALETLLSLWQMFTIFIEVLCYQPKIDQLKFVELMILLVVRVVSNADIMGLEVVVDIADFM